MSNSDFATMMEDNRKDYYSGKFNDIGRLNIVAWMGEQVLFNEGRFNLFCKALRDSDAPPAPEPASADKWTPKVGERVEVGGDSEGWRIGLRGSVTAVFETVAIVRIDEDGDRTHPVAIADLIAVPAPEPASGAVEAVTFQPPAVDEGAIDWKAAMQTIEQQATKLQENEEAIDTLRAELERVRDILNAVYAERDNARDDADGLRAQLDAAEKQRDRACQLLTRLAENAPDMSLGSLSDGFCTALYNTDTYLAALASPDEDAALATGAPQP